MYEATVHTVFVPVASRFWKVAIYLAYFEPAELRYIPHLAIHNTL